MKRNGDGDEEKTGVTKSIQKVKGDKENQGETEEQTKANIRVEDGRGNDNECQEWAYECAAVAGGGGTLLAASVVDGHTPLVRLFIPSLTVCCDGKW